MVKHRTYLFLAAVLLTAGFAAGYIVGVGTPHYHPSQRHPDFKPAVDEMFVLWQQGNVVKTRDIEVLEQIVTVDVVETVHGAEYGFCRSSKTPDVTWLAGAGHFEILTYRKGVLFVIIKR